MTRLSVLAILIVLGGGLRAQDGAGPSAVVRVERTQRVTHVNTRLHIMNASSKSMLVPICGGDLKDLLCSPLAVHVEVPHHANWKPAQSKCECPLGGLPLAEGRWLEPGEAAYFNFDLPVEFYKLRKGQTVRLRLDVYPNEGAMKNMQGSSALYSQPFSLP